MNILDEIKKHGKPHKIKGHSRADIGTICKELGLTTGAEIGVYKGEYTKQLLDKGLKVYGIDPWKAFWGQGRTQNRQDRQDFLYGHTQRYLDEYIKNGQCELIRKTSTEALKDFKDGSLDFVYIDGDHTFAHAAHDIYYWSKKVKKGGIIAGHDYFITPFYARNVWCHVKVVVDAYTQLYDIKDWYLIGNLPTEQVTSGKQKGDLYWSWFWFNPDLPL